MPMDEELYPDDWSKRSYFVRFVRANGECEFCGKTDQDCVLTTANVWSFTEDGNHHLDNLMSACEACHLHIDQPEKEYHRKASVLDGAKQYFLREKVRRVMDLIKTPGAKIRDRRGDFNLMGES